MVFTTLLLDQSGSMAGREAEVIAASNQFIEQLAREPVDQQAALATFEERLQPVREMQPLGLFAPLTHADYHPNGGTALYDALDQAIVRMGPQVGEKGRGILAVVTDGHDTNSRTTAPAARRAMDDLRKTGRWMFVFLSLGDASLSSTLRTELGLDATDILTGNKSMLSAAMKQLGSKVRGYLKA